MEEGAEPRWYGVETTTAAERRRLSRWIVLIPLAALAVWLTTLLLVEEDRQLTGLQYVSPTTTVTSAMGGEWVAMDQVGGPKREGFPAPMVRRDETICIGFERLDFDAADRRPSLARCVDELTLDALSENGIVALMSVRSGLDTWHFLEAGADVDAVEITLDDGEQVEQDRRHLAGPTIALRLENERDLADIRWRIDGAVVSCTPQSAAWVSGLFCTG